MIDTKPFHGLFSFEWSTEKPKSPKVINLEIERIDRTMDKIYEEASLEIEGEQ